MGSAEVRVHLRIRGRVQGVYFRATTKRQADALGLNGWVRNRPDGSVEVVVEGDPAQVEPLVAWAHDGPDMARVDQIDRTDEEPVGLAGGFRVRPTG